MSKEITIPVFLNADQDGEVIVDGPASISDAIKAGANKVIASLSIDEQTLNACIQSAQSVIQFIRQQTSGNPVKLSSISLELGVSSTGKVGFIGTGLDVELAATMQLTLEVD